MIFFVKIAFYVSFHTYKLFILILQYKNPGYEFEILLQIYISLKEKKADYHNCCRISSGENKYKSKRNEPLRNLTCARAKLALEILGL